MLAAGISILAKTIDVGTYSLLPAHAEALKGATHLTILSVDDLGCYQPVAPCHAFWHDPNVEKLGNSVEKAREMLQAARFR